jgi:hypothetical protein
MLQVTIIIKVKRLIKRKEETKNFLNLINKMFPKIWKEICFNKISNNRNSLNHKKRIVKYRIKTNHQFWTMIINSNRVCQQKRMNRIRNKKQIENIKKEKIFRVITKKEKMNNN